MRAILVGLCGVLLAGCVAPGPSEREIALSSLVGQPESEAVKLLGVPSRSFETGGKRYLAYSESRLDAYPGFVPYGGYYSRYRGFYGGLYGPQIVQRACETTLEIANGKVASFALRGNACG
jgi:hypothetical protein